MNDVSSRAPTFEKNLENSPLPNQTERVEQTRSVSEIIQSSTNSIDAIDIPPVLQDRHVVNTPRDDTRGFEASSLFTPQKTNIVFIAGIVLMVISIVVVAISFVF